ncbi:MAG: O-antigen ligase family protein [Bacteroidota bacterium]
MLLLLYAFAYSVPVAPLVPGLALLGGWGFWRICQHPAASLFVVLCAFVLVADFEEGTQINEIVYAALFGAYAVHWVVTRALLRSERVVKTPLDAAVALFLLLIGWGFAMGALNGGSFRAAIGDAIGLSMFFFYFPIKEVVSRYRRGAPLVFGAFLLLGLFASVRNLLLFREMISNATMIWEIARGRVITNESLLMLPGVLAVVLLLYVRTWSQRAVLAVIGGLLFVSLILTQSRSYWIDYAVGMGLLFVLLDAGRRWRLLQLGVVAGTAAAVIAYLVLGGAVFLLIFGVVERFLSIGTANTEDISMINRFYESRAVLELISANPILGYGLGVQYSVYDLTIDANWVKTFVHNGYLMIWYKLGIVGLVTIVSMFGLSIRAGWRALRAAPQATTRRVWALAALVGFVAGLPSTLVALPFVAADTSIILAAMMGVMAGLLVKSKASRAPLPEARSAAHI